jgi:hypothetical protein
MFSPCAAEHHIGSFDAAKAKVEDQIHSVFGAIVSMFIRAHLAPRRFTENCRKKYDFSLMPAEVYNLRRG